MAKIIGIDLGTTYSAVSIWDEKRQTAVIIPNLQGESTTPSIVSVNKAGEVIVGKQARRNIWERPNDTISQIKRNMGENYSVTMNGKVYNPQTISAFILSYLKQCAEHYLGEPVYDAVITVPAHFKEVQKTATRDAGRIAGLNVHQLVNEPTAAAIAYGISKAEKGEEKTYAVYDLGGGTFDVSIIVVGPEDITVIGTGGDSRLGGLDMDEAVMKWALSKIKRDYGVDLSSDEAAKRRLKVEAEDIKRTLVISENTELSIPYLTVIDGQPLNVDLSITRSQFDGLILPLLKRSLRSLDEAVTSADKQNSLGEYAGLDGVLLVGGPTRLPKIREVLREHIREKLQGKELEIRADVNPDEVVAMGAAITAAQMKPLGRPPEEIEEMKPEEVEQIKEESTETSNVPSMQITDVTGHSLGIAVQEGRFYKLIEKDRVIPCQVTRPGFTNGGDYTREIRVTVYQGEGEFIYENTKIGEVQFDVEPLPRGQHQFQVQFALDVSGTLSTIVTDQRANRTFEGSFAFDGVVRMNADEIKRKREELKSMMGGNKETKTPLKPKENTGPITVPQLTRDQVPAQWYDYWLESGELLNKLDPAEKQALASAMTSFANAVMSGDKQKIEKEGEMLQDAFLAAQI